MVYPALIPLMRTPQLPVIDWTDAPANLNGLVRFAERRNLVSARVSSHFNWPLQAYMQHLILCITFICCYTGLFKMIVGVLTTCHTQYTSDSSICILLFNRTTLQVVVTYLTGALYVRNCRWTTVTDRHSWNVSTQNAFSLPLASILVNCAPSGEMHNYCTPHIKENFENSLIHRCNYILLSEVYCVWQVVKTPTDNHFE
jgi:hypothetical protein